MGLCLPAAPNTQEAAEHDMWWRIITPQSLESLSTLLNSHTLREIHDERRTEGNERDREEN